VVLYDGSRPKKPKSFLVHRLVAEAFLGQSDLQVNHKNGDKSDNRLDNLEFVTCIENARHAVDVLGRNLGDKNHKCKLTWEQVCEIRESKLTLKEISAAFGLNKDYVSQIRRGEYRKNA
jgi:hypothetical protein